MSTAARDSQLLCLAEHVEFALVDDSAVLLDRRNGIYLGLNEVGTRILQLLEEHREIHPVLEALQSEYEVGEERLRRDVEAVIDELTERGLLDVRPR